MNKTMIKKHFEDLDYKISLNKIARKGDEIGRHLLEWQAGGDACRLVELVVYYFGMNTTEVSYGTCSVILNDFNPDGHGITGICKQCGCTQNDACPDIDTGTCFWVYEDMCSACALPDERQAALDEMAGFDGKESAAV